jgi:hypothetical protein
MTHDRKALITIGLEDAAAWIEAGDKLRTVGDKSARWRWLTAKPRALYAFCSGNKVLYIGRTTQTLSKRFLGNHICDSAIRKLLAQGKEVRILVMPGRSPLPWESFPVDLAAGLEAALVKAFAPPWNKSKDGLLATETQSSELAAE